MDYVIKISSGYYTNKNKDKLIFDDNFEDAIIFENTTEEEARKFAKQKFRGLKTSVYPMEYNAAKMEYEKRIYVDQETKNYRWGNYIDIKNAIELNKQNNIMVGYQYNDIVKIFNGNELPQQLDIDIILNAKWRIIEKVNSF